MCSGTNDPKRFLLELNEQNLARAIGWVAVADSKARFVLSVVLVLTGLLITRLSSTADIFGALWKTENCGALFLYGGLLLSTIAALLVCLLFLVRIIYPKRKPHTGIESYFFYESIANMSVAKFHDRMRTMSEEDVIQGLSDQTYNVSKVVKKKFDQLSTSIGWFCVAVVLLVLFFLVHTVFAKIWLSVPSPA